jgi:hypothetical protein
MGYLVDDIDTIWEVFDQSTIEVNTVSFLPDIQVIVGVIKVIHPVILTCTGLQKLKHYRLPEL